MKRKILKFPLDPMDSDLDTISLVAALVAVIKPRVFVEAGTYHGAVALTVASVMRDHNIDGHIWTAEVVNKAMDVAVDRTRKTKLEDYITFCYGDYVDMLHKVNVTDIDMAYIDGGFRLPMIKETLPRLSKYGLILVDDMACGHWGNESARKEVEDNLSVFLPEGRGLGIIQKDWS
jgi:predicted O-methyltransferase YrrM